MLVIAHRGANKEAFENSWSAFDKAVEVGADRIELDIQLTKDNELVVIHDPSLLHGCGINKKTTDLTRQELAALRLKNDEPLPFLDQVVEKLLPKIELNIEIKPNGTLAAEHAVQIVNRYPQWADRVIFSSFLPTPLAYLADNYPAIRTACLWGDVIDWPHCAHFAPPLFMQRCHTKIFHPWSAYLTDNVMDQARARGWIVYPWVSMKGEDSQREVLWERMADLKIDGLCTNYPRELKQWTTMRDQTCQA